MTLHYYYYYYLLFIFLIVLRERDISHLDLVRGDDGVINFVWDDFALQVFALIIYWPNHCFPPEL